MFAAAAGGRPILVADPTLPPPVIGAVPDGTWLIVVTSGSSGAPRPVLRTAASWVSSFEEFSRLTGIGRDDRVLLAGPLHATLYLFAAVHTLSVGAELTDRIDAATVVHAVPAVLDDLLTALPPAAPLRTAVVAGAALTGDLAARVVNRGIDVIEYYGAAELSFVAARRWPGPLRPFPGSEVMLRPAPGVPGGAAQELWVRSGYLSMGYPAGVTGPFRQGDDGYGTVGDLAEWAPDGGLLIRGRGDAAVTTGGATVLAEDVEAALGRLAGLAAVVVVGVPHQRLGQVLTAVVQPLHGADPADLADLRRKARRVLRDAALPRRWLLADRLPLTPSGKIARRPVADAAARFALGLPAAEGAPPLRPLP